ncbi:hypothetical protein TL18_10400 [Methanobrevibacter sp. YE315]|uniref:hypothetical protein n=1 Tax=Methanobrevibacter sp. YE315 TaxID=1609968 RepID=UPI000764E5C3|nr:hypothetical protein [Methanobrevibacter sp. YE315]AMD18380.1 hypothetical protein TL18_10400 [Methanobrevibacter sp. YE315]
MSSFVQCAGENEGKYLISASLCDYYNLSKTLNVLGIDIIDPEITTYSGGSQTFKVHLEGNKNVISKKPINVLFNLKNYLEYSDENGDAIILINNVPASPGKYNISTEVYGVYSTSTVNVLSTIIAEDVVRQYGLDSPFTVSFTDKTGQYLTMGKLIGYQIDNLRTKYSPILNDEGLFDIDVSSLDVGEHNITVFNLLTKENATFSVGILPKFGAELNDGDSQQSLDNKSNGMSGAGNSFNPLYLSGGHAESDFNNDDMANGTASNNDLANKSSTVPVKSIDNQSNSNFNFLWLLLILLVIGGYLIWKKYKK